MATYKEAIQLEPNYVFAHYRLGGAYIIIGNREAALEQYEILKELDPDKAQALLNLINEN